MSAASPIKRFFEALLLSQIFFWLSSGCSYTKVSGVEKAPPAADTTVAEVNNFQPSGDSSYVPGYYYRYIFKTKEEWDRQPDWFIGNLKHFGIMFRDAWYIVTDRPDRGKPYRLPTSFPPGLVVVLEFDNPDILQHHYLKCAPCPLSTFEAWAHYDSTAQH